MIMCERSLRFSKEEFLAIVQEYIDKRLPNEKVKVLGWDVLPSDDRPYQFMLNPIRYE